MEIEPRRQDYRLRSSSQCFPIDRSAVRKLARWDTCRVQKWPWILPPLRRSCVRLVSDMSGQLQYVARTGLRSLWLIWVFTWELNFNLVFEREFGMLRDAALTFFFLFFFVKHLAVQTQDYCSVSYPWSVFKISSEGVAWSLRQVNYDVDRSWSRSRCR